VPGHTGEGPLIVAGVAGAAALTTTAAVLAVLVPQELVAVTVMFPLAAEAPAATVIEFVVEVPVQPEGKVQV
jgi:hypothetical protein